MRILLAGGGSGGSSAPVLAVAQELRRRGECKFLYVGTETGPEREMVTRLGIPYQSVLTGKLRRYWSLQNFVDLFRIPAGWAQSLGVVRRFQPDVAFAAGGFAAVPPLLAAGFLRVPTVIHQQDVEPGLANRILAPFATAITVTFPRSLDHFPESKTRVTGNPVREEILSANREDAVKLLSLEEGRPLVLATGGGTGAMGLNKLVADAAPTLTAECQILHLTGKGKAVEIGAPIPGYQQREFLLEGMGPALAAADLVISRAGLSTLTELAVLGKPSMLIPMPNSHQNANAAVFAAGRAALVLRESDLSGPQLAKVVLALLRDPERLSSLGERAREMMPAHAEVAIADTIMAVRNHSATR